jgi:hypothetical protein
MIGVSGHGRTMTHEQRSLDHFLDIYKTLDPAEIAHRCGLPFDGEAFSLRIMGKSYRACFPVFELRESGGGTLERGYEKILFLRYLCGGKYTPPSDKRLSYREIPWGEVYYRNFEGRCIRRLAMTFGNKIESFRKIMEGTPGLRAENLAEGDAGYRFEFSSGFYMSFLVWTADDEFPPSAQILFDNNFPAAFTAEDIAVACGVAVDHLKDMMRPPEG